MWVFTVSVSDFVFGVKIVLSFENDCIPKCWKRLFKVFENFLSSNIAKIVGTRF